MSDERMTRLDQVDPLPLLRELIRRGEGDSATMTLLRLQWLRREEPGAQVETDIVPIDGRLIGLKARIAVPDRWSVSAHAAVELPDNPAPAIEQAEYRALSRALDLAGYALTEVPANLSAPRFDTETDKPAETEPPEAPPPAPAPRVVARPAVVDALRKVTPRPEPATAPEPATVPQRPQRGDFTVVHDRRGPAPAPAERSPAPATEDDGNDTPLEDYSWTAFWRWAKGQGLNSPAEIAAVIGQPVDRLTPGELRTLLREHGVEG